MRNLARRLWVVVLLGGTVGGVVLSLFWYKGSKGRDLLTASRIAGDLRERLCARENVPNEATIDAYIAKLKASSLDAQLVESEELTLRALFATNATDSERRDRWSRLISRCQELKRTNCNTDYLERYAATVCAKRLDTKVGDDRAR